MTDSDSYGTIEKAQIDLALLNQSLERSKNITDQTLGKLKSSNERLILLEKSLVPIYKQTGRVMVLHTNLNTCLSSLNSLLGHQDLAETEAPLIDSGPNLGNLKPYIRSLERLIASTEALQHSDIRQTNTTIQPMLNVIDRGTSQLVKAFAELAVSESEPASIGGLYDQGVSMPSLPPSFFSKAIPVLDILKSLNPEKLNKAERLYADARSNYLEESLAGVFSDALADAQLMNLLSIGEASAVDVLEGKDDSAYGYGLRRSFGCMLALARNEQTLVDTLFKKSSSPSSQRTIYGNIVLEPARKFNDLLAQVIESNKSFGPAASFPLNFTSMVELKEEAPEYAELYMSKVPYKQIAEDFDASLVEMQKMALKGLKELPNEIALFSSSSQVLHAGVTELLITAVTILKRLSQFEKKANVLTESLGYKKPASASSQQASPSKVWSENVPSLAEYTSQVVSSLVSAIDSRAVNMGLRPEATVMFLVNNVSFLRRNVLSNHFSTYLSETLVDELSRRLRLASTNYLDTLWAPLVAALESSDLPGLKKGKTVSARDRLNIFYERWQDNLQLHKIARIDDRELELRDHMRTDVERLLVPTYIRFVTANRFNDLKVRYSRMDPDSFTEDLQALFM